MNAISPAQAAALARARAQARARLKRRLNHVPAGLIGTGSVAVVAITVAAIMRGRPGAAGAVVGAAGVLASYLLSSFVVAWADAISPQLVMPVGMATYFLKFSLLGMVLIGFSGSTWAGTHP